MLQPFPGDARASGRLFVTGERPRPRSHSIPPASHGAVVDGLHPSRYGDNALPDDHSLLTSGNPHNLDTDDVAEGSSNLYITNERVDDRVKDLLIGGTGITLT